MIIRRGIGVVLTAVFIVLAVRNLEYSQLVGYLKNLSFPCLLASMSVFACSYFVRAWRWKIASGPEITLPFLRFSKILMAGMLINEIFPARAGDFYQAHRISQTTSQRFASALAVRGIIRVFEGLTLTFLLVIALRLDPHCDTVFRALRISTITVFSIAALGVFFIAFTPELSFRVASWLTRRFSNKAGETLAQAIRDFLAGLQVLKSPTRLARVLLLSFLHWGVEIVSFILIFCALGVTWNVATPVLVLSAVCFACLLPSVPGGLGIFEYAVILALSTQGVTENQAFALAVVLHLSQLLVTASLGLYGWFKES